MGTNRSSSSQIASFLTSTLIFSLFFDRSGNVYVFYFAFFLYSIFSISQLRLSSIISSAKFIIIRYSLFTAFSALSIIWARNQEWATEMVVRQLTLLFLLVILNNNALKFSLTKPFVIGLAAGLLLNFLLYLLPVTSFTYRNDRFIGTFNNPNTLAVVSLFFIYFLTKCHTNHIIKIGRKTYYFLLMVTVLLIIAAGSRKGFLFGFTLVALSILSSARNKKYYKLYLIISVVFIILTALFMYLNWTSLVERYTIFYRFQGIIDFLNGGEGDSSTKWRNIFIQEGILIFNINPIKGIGIHNFQTLFREGLYAHNNYVELLVDVGIIGFSIFYSIYLGILIFLKRNKAKLFDFAFVFILLVMEYAMVTYFERIYWIPVLFFVLINKKHIHEKPHSKNFKYSST